jgi:transcriptional regulator with XRE-family HTH domain
MTVLAHQNLPVIQLGGARTRETGPPTVIHHSCVPTRSDWPQDEFLAWFDAAKAGAGLKSDYQFAQYLDIGHTLISGWRNSRQRPSVETLSKIAAKLGEDPRRLWVLVGAVKAADIGLDESERLVVRPPLPQELQDLITAYLDERLDERDREAIRRHVRILTQSIHGDLEARQRETTKPRRTGRAS